MLNDPDNKELALKISFTNKVSNKVLEIVENNFDKKIVIESGEWEGLGQEIFRLIKRPNILFVTRIHTPLATCIKQNNLRRSASSALQLISEYKTIISADCVTACTNYVKERMIEDVLGKNCLFSEDIRVIPNPIDSELFKLVQTDREASINFVNSILGRDFLTDKTFNVFIIGSVEDRKGVKYVIDAIPAVVDSLSNIRFCFVGHCGIDEDINLNANTKLSPKKLLDRIPEKYHSVVAFTNYIDHKDLPLLIQCGDVFPIMSIGDNFPGTVAEISLSSKPILALARGGVKEMLTDSQGRFMAFNLGESLDLATSNLVRGIKIL